MLLFLLSSHLESFVQDFNGHANNVPHKKVRLDTNKI